MKKSRYTEEQIVGILKESEAGLATAELCRKHGISEQTFYRWKAKYGGLEVSEAQRLGHLEEENRKLKQLVAEQALDIVGFKAVLSKKWEAHRRNGKPLEYFVSRRGARNDMPVGSWKCCVRWFGIAGGRRALPKPTSSFGYACESWPKSGAAGDIGDCTFFCDGKAGP